MKFNKLLLNFTVGLSALLFGLGWVGVYQYLLDRFEDRNVKTETVEVINPLDLEIEKMTPSAAPPIPPPDDMMKEKSITITPSDSNFTEKQKFQMNLDIEGYYEPYSVTPESTPDFSMEIWFGRYDEKLKEWIQTPPNGFIEIDSKKFEFDKFSYSHGKLYFSTIKKGGIYYEFSGYYSFRTVDLGSGPTEVLDGTLIRKKNKKATSTSKMSLYWSVGC